MRKILSMFTLALILNACDDSSSNSQIISFKVPSYYEGDEEKYIFLTDLDGKLIDLAEVQNDAIVQLKIPIYARAPITVNFFSALVHSNGITRDFYSYVGVQPGEYVLTGFPTPYSELFDFAIDLESMPDTTNFVVAGGYVISQGTDKVHGYISRRPNGPTTVLACAFDVSGDDHRYQFLDFKETNLQVFDFDVALPIRTAYMDLPGDTYTLTQTVFKEDRGFTIQQVSRLNDGERSIKLYGSESFESHYTSVSVNNLIDAVHTNEYWGNEFPSQFEPLAASATIARESEFEFTIKTTGHADAIRVGSVIFENIAGQNIADTRAIFLPFDQIVNFKHPSIPKQLISKYFPHGERMYKLGGAVLIDYDTIDYQQFINFRVQNPEYFHSPLTSLQDNTRAKSFSF